MQLVAIIVSLTLTAVTIPVVALAVRKMVRVIGAGGPAPNRADSPMQRTVTMLKETFGHTRMLQWTWIGIMHWFVYLAFLLLSTAVLAGYFQLFDATFVLPIIGGFFAFEWVSEGIGLLGTIGIIYLVVLRQRNHPRSQGRQSRFFGSRFWQAYFVETLVLFESSAILFVRAAEYKLLQALGDDHADRFHFPIAGYLGDLLFGGLGQSGLENAIYAIATFKIALAMVFLLVLATNLTMGVAWHRFTAWPNIWFKRNADGSTALGGLEPIRIRGEALDMEALEDLEEEDFEKLGVGQVEDFSWKGLLDFTTCTECGRCQSQCPAWNTEKPLSPKLLVMGLREHAYAKAPLLDADPETLTEEQKAELERPLIGDEELFGVIDPDVLWSCTNCGACVQQCPVDIEHVDHIEDMRRFQVLVESNFPTELNNIFKGLERKGNPWGMNPKNRMDWAKDLDFEVKQVGVDVEDLDEVDWLFWVGCAGAFEDRAKKTTQAVAELLHTAGVDFAVLGDGETCTGDPARRAGNEIVFMQLAMENAEVLKETKAKKVVSTCAHCFNTLKNEYAEFGVELEVVHHTQLLNRLVREKQLTPVAPSANGAGSNGAGSNGAGEAKTITYHDPCFLGRHNQVYEAPRELLNVIPGAKFAEMPRNSEQSFCCGAGGARMWMEETLGSRININRTQEAVATGAEQIAVGCPFCRVMLSDGLTAQQAAGEAGEQVEVLDVAQMLLASVKRAPEAEPAQATQAEPDAEDRADEASLSDTDASHPAADAHTDPAATAAAATDGPKDDPEPASAEADQQVAAQHNIAVDEKGTADDLAGGDPGKAPDPAAETVEQGETSASGGPEDVTESDSVDEEVTEQPEVGDADEGDASGEEAEQTPTPQAPEDAGGGAGQGAADTSEKEKGAWANVGAVNTDLTPSSTPEPEPGDVTDPETESEQAESDEKSGDDQVVEGDARREEAAVTAVEDAPSSEVVSEDTAPLSEANPSGPDLSDDATRAAETEDSDDESRD